MSTSAKNIWHITSEGTLLLSSLSDGSTSVASALLPWTPPHSRARATSVAPLTVDNVPLLLVTVQDDAQLHVVDPISRRTLACGGGGGGLAQSPHYALKFARGSVPTAARALPDAAENWGGSGDSTAVAVGLADGYLWICGTWRKEAEGGLIANGSSSEEGSDPARGRRLPIAKAAITAVALVGGGGAVCAARPRGESGGARPPCFIAVGCADGTLAVVRVDDESATLYPHLRCAPASGPRLAVRDIAAWCDASTALNVWSVHSGGDAAHSPSTLRVSRGPFRLDAAAKSSTLVEESERAIALSPAAVGARSSWRFATSVDAHRAVCLWLAHDGGVALHVFDQRDGAPTAGCTLHAPLDGALLQLDVAELALGRQRSGSRGRRAPTFDALALEIALRCALGTNDASGALTVVASIPAPSLGPLVWSDSSAAWTSAVLELAMLTSHAENKGRRGPGPTGVAFSPTRTHRERAFECLDALRAHAMSAQVCCMLLLQDRVAVGSGGSDMAGGAAATLSPGGLRVRCVGAEGELVAIDDAAAAAAAAAAANGGAIGIDDPGLVIEWVAAQLDEALDTGAAQSPRDAVAFEERAGRLRALRSISDALHYRLRGDRRMDDANVSGLRREKEMQTRAMQRRAQSGAIAADCGAWICDAAAATRGSPDAGADDVVAALCASEEARSARREELRRLAWKEWDDLAPAGEEGALDFKLATPLASRAADALHVLQWRAVGSADPADLALPSRGSDGAALWRFLIETFSAFRGDEAEGEEADKDHRSAQLLVLYLALDAFFPPAAVQGGDDARASPKSVVQSFEGRTAVSTTLGGVLLALWKLDASTPVRGRIPAAVNASDAASMVHLLMHPGISTLDPPELLFIALRQLLRFDCAAAALDFARLISVEQLVSVLDLESQRRDSSLPLLAIQARLACARGAPDDGSAAQTARSQSTAAHRNGLLCEAMEVLRRINRALQQHPSACADASAVLIASVLHWMSVHPRRFCQLSQFYFAPLQKISHGNSVGCAVAPPNASSWPRESDLVAQLASWAVTQRPSRPQLMDVAVSYFLQTHQPAVALALHRWHIWAVLSVLPLDQFTSGTVAGEGGVFGACALARINLIHTSISQLPRSMMDPSATPCVRSLPRLRGATFTVSDVADSACGGCTVRCTQACFADVMRRWCAVKQLGGGGESGAAAAAAAVVSIAEEIRQAVESGAPSLRMEERATTSGEALVEIWDVAASADTTAIAHRWTVRNFWDYVPLVVDASALLDAARKQRGEEVGSASVAAAAAAAASGMDVESSPVAAAVTVSKQRGFTPRSTKKRGVLSGAAGGEPKPQSAMQRIARTFDPASYSPGVISSGRKAPSEVVGGAAATAASSSSSSSSSVVFPPTVSQRSRLGVEQRSAFAATPNPIATASVTATVGSNLDHQFVAVAVDGDGAGMDVDGALGTAKQPVVSPPKSTLLRRSSRVRSTKKPSASARGKKKSSAATPMPPIPSLVESAAASASSQTKTTTGKTQGRAQMKRQWTHTLGEGGGREERLHRKVDSTTPAGEVGMEVDGRASEGYALPDPQVSTATRALSRSTTAEYEAALERNQAARLVHEQDDGDADADEDEDEVDEISEGAALLGFGRSSAALESEDNATLRRLRISRWVASSSFASQKRGCFAYWLRGRISGGTLPRLLTDVLLAHQTLPIEMSELQSGRTARRASLSRLLSFDEQVSTRSKALVSWCRVFATGGLALNVAPELLRVSCASKAKPPSRRRSQREATPSIAAAYSVTLLEVPYDVLAVSVAAMGGTNGGAFDFVIDKSEKLSLRMAARPKRRQKAAAKAVHPLGQFFALAGTVSGDGVSDDSSTAPRSWGEVYDAAEQDGSGSGGGGGGGAGPIGPRYCDVAAGGRLPAYLDVHACAIALRERIFLALRAFDDAVGRVQAAPLVAGAAAAVDSSTRRGHLKFPPLGFAAALAGASSDVEEHWSLECARNIARRMLPVVQHVLKMLLLERDDDFPNIGLVELVDLSSEEEPSAFDPAWAAARPAVSKRKGRAGRGRASASSAAAAAASASGAGGVELRSGLRIRCGATGQGLLSFTDAEREAHICGVVVCGEAFALAGNGAASCTAHSGYRSVEEAVGNNSDFRFVQAYPNNAHLLDGAHHVAVELPSDLHSQ